MNKKITVKRILQLLIILIVIFLIVTILLPMNHKHGLRDDAKMAYELNVIHELRTNIKLLSIVCKDQKSIEDTEFGNHNMTINCDGLPKKISVINHGTLKLSNNADGSIENQYPLGLYIPVESFQEPRLWKTEALENGKVKILGLASNSIESYINTDSHWVYDPADGNVIFYRNGVISRFLEWE